MSQPGSYFIVIPAEVRHAKGVAEGAKLLYGDICGLADRYGYCFATNAHLARIAGKQDRQIYTYLDALETKGFIRREDVDGQRRIYVTLRKNAESPAENCAEPHAEKCGHTNTLITNTNTTTGVVDLDVSGVAEYFEERGAKPRCAENMAHSFVAYYSHPSKQSLVEGGFRRRAATWFAKADKAGEVERGSSKKRYTLDEIRIHPGLDNYDVTRFRKDKDGFYYER